MPSHSIRRHAWLAVLSTLLVSQFAAAQTGGPSTSETTPPGSSHPPAKEAIDACVGKNAGDRVQFIDAKNKKRKWVCVLVDGTLAARSGVATSASKAKPK